MLLIVRGLFYLLFVIGSREESRFYNISGNGAVIFIIADHIKDCKLCLLIFLLYICWMNTQDLQM